jgi:hypothetical protein
MDNALSLSEAADSFWFGAFPPFDGERMFGSVHSLDLVNLMERRWQFKHGSTDVGSNSLCDGRRS